MFLDFNLNELRSLLNYLLIVLVGNRLVQSNPKAIRTIVIGKVCHLGPDETLAPLFD